MIADETDRLKRTYCPGPRASGLSRVPSENGGNMDSTTAVKTMLAEMAALTEFETIEQRIAPAEPSPA